MDFLENETHDEEKPDRLASSQNISFTGSDGHREETVVASNVMINSSAGDHDHGSSKVKFKNVVDYNWEQKLYTGQLLAVHVEGKFLAYSLSVPHQPGSGKVNGVVRVAHQSVEKRALLKEMRGQVHDLSFAYITSQILLGCINEEGDLFVYEIRLNTDAIMHSLILNIRIEPHVGVEHRIIWCSYIPDEEDSDSDSEDDIAKLLLTTHGNKAYIWKVGMLAPRFNKEPLTLNDLADSYHCIKDHSRPIIDAAFSPDGTSLATASLDGCVMFFQGYMDSVPAKCVYKWSPHNGKPLSSLFFLDNHKSTEQFWKFVVTGAENNSVLRVWSCKSWKCLQTIEFAPGPKYSIALKAGLDRSAKYLLLSDINRRALFILQFENIDENIVCCKKAFEFYLPYPILSFGIVDASLQRVKRLSGCSDIFDQSAIYHSPSESPDDLKRAENEGIHQDILTNGCEDIDDDIGDTNTVIRLYLIQPNRLQEGHITLVPFNESANNHIVKSRNSPDITLNYSNNLPNVIQEVDTSILIASQNKSLTEKDETVLPSDIQQPLNTVLAQQSQQLKNLLMRPQQMSTSGYSKQSTSPITSGNMPNISFVPLIPLMQPSSGVSQSSIQPALNLMTPDAFSSAKRDEEDPPIAESPDMMKLPPAPILDSDMQLISNKLSIDSSPLVNAESLNSLTGNTRVFGNNTTQTLSCDRKFASGGSSPSREVQEILSVKGSECFFEDEFEDNINTQSPQWISSTVTSQNKVNYSGSKAMPQKLTNQCKSNDNSEKSNHSLNLSKIIDLADDNSQNISAIDKKDENNKGSFSPVSNLDTKSVVTKLDEVMGFMLAQQKEIMLLRNELSMLRRIVQNTSSVTDESLSKILDQAMLQNQVQLNLMVEAAISNRVETDKANREALLSGVSQLIGAQLAEKLNASIAHEACNTLAPRLERIIEPLASSLQVELARKLTATDHLLAENIQRMINNKSVMDSLSIAVAHNVTGATKEAFKETIQTSLLPHMEKAQSQMFKQLNQSFNSGTKEYLSAFENCTKRSLEINNVIDDTTTRVKSVALQLQTALDQQSKSHIINSQSLQAVKQLNSLSKELQTVISSTLHGALEHQLSPIKECIREQITTGMAAQAAQLEDCVLSAVRSGTQTPAPSIVDTQVQQMHIDHLLNSGQTNAAFQYALSASDLKLVVYACTVADPRKVFFNPCPLQPNVLLSLIQQLSADMTSDTQLKSQYLREAITYLDSEHPLTKEHMPIVLKELQKQLNNFLTQNPNNHAYRHLKFVLLATDSLLKT